MALTAGPKLDAKIAKWHGGYLSSAGTSEVVMCALLDTLIARGYEPVLLYDKVAKLWGLALRWDFGEEAHLMIVPCYKVEWQPTRALAVCAAVLALMEGEDG